MCQRVNCSVCHKPSYVGCGMHVEQVLGDVTPENRCRCREERAEAKKQAPSIFERLLGGRRPSDAPERERDR